MVLLTKHPRTQQYLSVLPKGLDSYPGCQTKGSILKTYVDCHPVTTSLVGPFRELTGIDVSGTLPSEWLPTVHVNVFELMVADALDSEEAFLAAARSANERLLSTRLYRAIVAVSSPGFLVRTASSRWGHFHRGAPLVGRVDGNSARLTLGFPSDLHPELIAREKADVYAVSITAAGAQLTELDVSADRTEARIRMRWE